MNFIIVCVRVSVCACVYICPEWKRKKNYGVKKGRDQERSEVPTQIIC